MEVATIFTALLLLIFFGPALIKWKQALDHATLLRRYSEITEPIFVRSFDPDDTEVFARAERHRALLLESGNKWKPPVFTIIYGEAGFYGESWGHFCARAAEFERLEMNDWLIEVKRRDLLAYYQTSLRQRATLN